MDRLNALYEELMWETDDILEFVADYKNNQIVIRNRSQDWVFILIDFYVKFCYNKYISEEFLTIYLGLERIALPCRLLLNQDL